MVNRHRSRHEHKGYAPGLNSVNSLCSARDTSNAGLTPTTTGSPHLASCETCGVVDLPVVVTVDPKHPLSFGGVYQ